MDAWTPRLRASFRLGELRIDALSDGAVRRDLSALFDGATATQLAAMFRVGSPVSLSPFNYGCFLVRGDGHATLIDSGWGIGQRGIIRGGGGLLDRLAEVGADPGAVTAIVHTHLHADHVGWNVVDGDAVPTFPNAQVFVSGAELDHWMTPPGGAVQDHVRRSIVPLFEAGRVRAVSPGSTVAPGISMIASPGHTPGHCSVLVTSAGRDLLIVGDAAHHPVHLVEQQWVPAIDVDPAASRRSRRSLAELAVQRNALVTGGHWPVLTVGGLERSRNAYGWRGIPVTEIDELSAENGTDNAQIRSQTVI